MAHAHDVVLKDLVVLLQDGTRITLQRNADDELISTGFAPGSDKLAADALPAGLKVVGFGPWPTWSSNLNSRTATLPDEESGLFEPERLFVLREQYVFFERAGAKPLSFGPIDKAWWLGTEHIVQARQVSGKH